MSKILLVGGVLVAFAVAAAFHPQNIGLFVLLGFLVLLVVGQMLARSQRRGPRNRDWWYDGTTGWSGFSGPVHAHSGSSVSNDCAVSSSAGGGDSGGGCGGGGGD